MNDGHGGHGGADALHHHRRRMGGRDPHEAHRVATPLELLFDLTFVAAFAVAAGQLAHMLAAGHVIAALIAFGIAAFAICWAWINFAWFASAFDTDDWLFRLLTMVQMAGVLLLSIGLPALFASVEHGVHLDNRVVVAGYVVMRLALIAQWLRVARQDPAHAASARRYATGIGLVQVGWVVALVADPPLAVALAGLSILALIEIAVPVIAESRDGGTPWHAHHIAERYGLFAIIALGEGIAGTIAAISAVIEAQGWSLDAALVCLAGTGLTFAMWWIYYMLPSAESLHAHRDRAFVWGYGQMVPIVAIVATGAGLHVAAYAIEHESRLGAMSTLLSVAVPVAIYIAGIYALYGWLVRAIERFHLALLAATAAAIALAIVAAAIGVPMAWCLVVLTLAPVITVIGYELRGYRAAHRALSAGR